MQYIRKEAWLELDLDTQYTRRAGATCIIVHMTNEMLPQYTPASCEIEIISLKEYNTTEITGWLLLNVYTYV